MAIRLTPERILHALVAAVFIVWLILQATGCAAKTIVEEPELNIPVTVITLAGATPWTIAGLLSLVWGLRARQHRMTTRQHRTTTGALDRVLMAVDEIGSNGSLRDGVAVRRIKDTVMSHYKCGPHGEVIIDRPERLIRSRLERWKK